MSTFRSGFVAIVGRPNVGKSTFLNQVLKEKVSIISSKPQTTRNQIRGIYTTDTEQIIFIDTPGIHKPKHELGNYMNAQAVDTLKEVDLILLLIDATQEYGSGDEFVKQLLIKTKTPCIFVFNKIDLIRDKNKLMENVVKFTQNIPYKEVFYISALLGQHVDSLLETVISCLEEGPMYYPVNQTTDHPETFIISEIIREKVLELTKEEVPHSVAVVIEEMKHDEQQLLNIRAVIIVERPSQKKIIIGQGGKMIKEIGTRARKEIVMIVGEKIYLELWVKVEEDWRNRTNQLKKYGYDPLTKRE
ncbi:MAG: GTPase Era [Bacilli bacterium]|jgi:GTP-binding protein Era|nr:GTPase Era [Bacilli bacterium]